MSDRKELVRQYKETPRQMGVYRIRNTANGKCFIGSARDVLGKLNGHRFQLRMKAHRNDVLQREWEEFGADAFVFEPLDLLKPSDQPDYDPGEDLQVLEELWLQKLRPFGDNGYNREGRGY
jgi:hypothetical protein